ncbi:MAG: helix-turn-helix transcriptional regulator [Streptosporangiaceae bacterium]
MAHDVSPTARALLALEVIQNSPGVTACRLGERLGVTERAARRYVAILREADLPIESLTGPYGGYRLGRGLRLPPLMFTAAEAMGLVMAVLEGHGGAADPADIVGSALAKITRVLPAGVASPVRALREVTPVPPARRTSASPELIAQLIGACDTERRVRLTYRLPTGTDTRTETFTDRSMDVDPWAVVLWHSRWYLLGWSHTKQAQRILRVDRIAAVEVLPDTFTPPPGLDALRTLEDHLSQGWDHPVDVLIDATVEDTARWIPRSLGRLEAAEPGRTRLRATTSEPEWYARQLAVIPAPFRVLASPGLQRATAALGQQLRQASEPGGAT